MTIALLVDTVAEAERIYAALAECARRIDVPLQKTEWSPAYAFLTDKFGVPFQINTLTPDKW